MTAALPKYRQGDPTSGDTQEFSYKVVVRDTPRESTCEQQEFEYCESDNKMREQQRFEY
jgi:hypothetical protein